MQRRFFSLASTVGLLAIASGVHAEPKRNSLTASFKRLEASSGGRLGVCILDTGTGRRLEHRGHERFPMCSTFKWLAAAHVLQRADAEQESLGQLIPIKRSEILPHSPFTELKVGGTMEMRALCEAAIIQSDNAAANLLLASFGGPAALTAFFRKLGDANTRLDRNEPALNEARPGDVRDTTTPSSMVHLLDKLLIGNALKASSKELLSNWLLANQTGDKRLRAGLPSGWKVGDKTGTGAFGTFNDVGIVWPPGRSPLLVAAYLTEASGRRESGDATLAAVGAMVSELVG